MWFRIPHTGHTSQFYDLLTLKASCVFSKVSIQWNNRMIQTLSPHISRFISAFHSRRSIYFFRVLIIFSCISILAWGNVSQQAQKISLAPLNTVLFHPFSADSHVVLAEWYKNHADNTRADNEIRLVKFLLPPHQQSSVLGVTDETSQVINTWETKPQKYHSSLSYWESVIHEHPDYRDAYLQASYFAALLNETTKALQYEKIAKELDPTERR